jgi:hypothetical protein
MNEALDREGPPGCVPKHDILHIDFSVKISQHTKQVPFFKTQDTTNNKKPAMVAPINNQPMLQHRSNIP